MSIPEVTIESADSGSLSMKVGDAYFFVNTKELDDVERWIHEIVVYVYYIGKDDSLQEIERNLLNTLRGVR